MKQIDINKALFETLKNDYNTHKQNKAYQSQLQSGFDYIEALIKFFASINISVVKNIDDEVYKDIFTKNFKLAPSLGDFKSLATVPFSKSTKNKLQNSKDELYDVLYNIFTKKISPLTLSYATSILENDNKTKKFNSTISILNEYIVSFRNKIKGHGASFKDEDTTLRDAILDNMHKVISQFEVTYDDIILEIIFEHDNSNITIKYKNTTCELLPIISYIECDKYSCNKNHKTKLFFYNDGKESKSHYIDYSFNHYFQITQKNEIHQNLKELQDTVLHSTSDNFRQSLLLSNFVGRGAELDSTKEHILNSIQKNQSLFISIVGKPGIGKSAFLTQLQQTIKEDETIQNSINTYTFYAQKNSMNIEEDKYLYKKITSYLDSLDISVKQDSNEFDMTVYLERLFEKYEATEDIKPLLLIIDGLDEFANPTDIIKKFPLNFSSKIHVVFSSRQYNNIMTTLSSKLSTKTEQLNILNEQNLIKSGYSLELGKLALNEVEELLSSVITKEISRESQEYQSIVNTIATQSEGLPLYIYYITQELKEKNINDDEDITQAIIKWAKKLPPKLENFYQDIFKTISPLARKILLILYFSRSGILKKDLYQILKNISSNDFITLDKTAFEVEVFNSIEVFLKLNDDNTYSFYHLSIKEAIQEYLKDQDELAILDLDKLKDDEILVDEMIKQNQEYIQNITYLDKQSDSYEFLEKLINYLKENNSSKYYNDNFFHLLNSLIWFDISHHQISFKNMQDKNYKSILTTTKISQQNSEAIDEFFKLFSTKEDKHLFEIRYAYELAFIKEDYTKVLEYKDMYENYIHELFLDICLNIDKDEYIEKFLKHKDDWENGLSEHKKDSFINIICKQDKLLNSIMNIIPFFENKHKALFIGRFTYQFFIDNYNLLDEHSQYKALQNLTFQIKENSIKDLLNLANDIIYSSEKQKSILLIALNFARYNNKDACKILYLIRKNSIFAPYDLIVTIDTYDIDLQTKLLAKEKIKIKWADENSLNEIFDKHSEEKNTILFNLALSINNPDKILSYIPTLENKRDNLYSQYSIKIVSKNIDESLFYIEKLNDNELKIETLLKLHTITNDIQFINKSLELLDKIDSKHHRKTNYLKILYFLVEINSNQTINKLDEINIRPNSPQNFYYAKVYLKLGIYLQDESLISKSFDIILKIKDFWGTDIALSGFICELLKYNLFDKAMQLKDKIKKDTEINKALVCLSSFIYFKNTNIAQQLLNNITDITMRDTAYLEIAQQISDKKDYNNFIYKYISSNNIKVKELWKNMSNIFSFKILYTIFPYNDTLSFVAQLSSNTILNYYNINIENENQSKITEFLNNLSSELKQMDDKKEKRKYFNKIKEQILDDEKLLNEFIEIYGEKFDIEDEDSFDDEFSLKNFENSYPT